MRQSLRFLSGSCVVVAAIALFSPVAFGQAVPAAERMANSRATVDSIRTALGRTMANLEKARQERDVAKVNFINEKTIALKGLMRIAEQADINLQEGLLKHDEQAAAHEDEKLAIALKKSGQLAAEADAYVGDVEIYTGDTQVDVSSPTEDPEEADVYALMPTVLMSARPVAASPYQ